MRKGTNVLRVLALVLLVCVMAVSLTSCLVGGIGGGFGGDYISREEVESMLKNQLIGDVTIENAPNYNITIENNGNKNLTAAAKSVLSAVSVQAGLSSGSGTSTGIASGAGVIYKLDGEGGAYIITNYHVVYDAYANNSYHASEKINVYLYGMEAKDYAIPATYVGGSMSLDIAVLKVTGSKILLESPATAVTIADSSTISILDTAIAIGNPASGGLSATVGAVNVDSERVIMKLADGSTPAEGQRLIRIDTPVNSGNSGGGLFNDQGELIGIVNAKNVQDGVDNIGYAIPSSIVKPVVDNIIDYCDGKNFWHPYRYLMGISVGIGEMYAEYDETSGRVNKVETARVASVSTTSPVRGKLEVGDIITKVDIDGVSIDITRYYQVSEFMYNARANSVVTIQILRDGVASTVVVNMSELSPSAQN